jgi:hypothetical protein
VNKKDSPIKRTRAVTASFADEDIEAMQLIKLLDPINPPTDSEITVWFARGQMARLLQGADDLKDIFDKFGKSPLPMSLLEDFLKRFNEFKARREATMPQMSAGFVSTCLVQTAGGEQG